MQRFKTLFPMIDEWLGLQRIDPMEQIEANARELAFSQLGCKTDLAKTIFQFIEIESELILKRKEKMFAELELPEFKIRMSNQGEQFGIWFHDLRVPRYKNFKYAVCNKDFEIDLIDCEFHNKPLALYVNIESYKVKTPRKMVATSFVGLGIWSRPSVFTEIEGSWRYEHDTDSAYRKLKPLVKQYIQDIENHINRNTIFINSIK